MACQQLASDASQVRVLRSCGRVARHAECLARWTGPNKIERVDVHGRLGCVRENEVTRIILCALRIEIATGDLKASFHQALGHSAPATEQIESASHGVFQGCSCLKMAVRISLFLFSRLVDALERLQSSLSQLATCSARLAFEQAPQDDVRARVVVALARMQLGLGRLRLPARLDRHRSFSASPASPLRSVARSSPR